MKRNTITTQRGQGLLISLAVLILISAVGAVAYTIISTESKEPAAQSATTSLMPSFTDSALLNIADRLASQHLSDKQGSFEQDIQALSNTLNNLQNSPQDAAKKTLTLLQTDKLSEAIDTLKVLALDTSAKREAAKLWVDIGNISNLLSDEAAIDAYQKSVTLDPDNINAWNRIGHLERQRENYDRAEIAYKNVTRLSDHLSQTQALSFANFGLLHQSQKKYSEAIQSFTEALSINTQLQNNAGIASNNENLASLYRTQKNHDLAEAHYLEALKIFETEKQTSKLIEIHAALGSLYQTKQEAELALSEYEKALSLNSANPNKRFSAGLYSNMGILAQQNNELDKAEDYFNQALALYQQLKQVRGTADQYSNLAILARNRKQFETSETLHLKAIDLYHAAEIEPSVITQNINLGFLYTAWNKKATACEYWTKSLQGLNKAEHQARRIRIEAIVERDCLPSSPSVKPLDVTQ